MLLYPLDSFFFNLGEMNDSIHRKHCIKFSYIKKIMDENFEHDLHPRLDRQNMLCSPSGIVPCSKK